MEKPIVLVIMDGVGKGDGGSGDAVAVAKTPTLDHLLATCPHTYLKAHGTAVGLPSDDDMGNSEVGHNALGCGQVYSQGAKLVGESIENGTLYASETWKDLVANALTGKAMHFLGLLSDGNVHSNIHHLIALLRQAHKEGVKKAYCHILLDGRDVPATSALEYVDMLEKTLAELNTEGCDYAIASGGGRMQVTMDRYEANWAMVEKGWRTHVQGQGRMFASAREAIETYRAETGCIDQDLPAFVIARDGKPVATIANGDSVILFNFRGDRAQEISLAFDRKDFDKFDRGDYTGVKFAGMLQYDGDLNIPEHYLVQPPVITNTLTEVLCKAGIHEYALSETQKYGHVTYFWNGNRSKREEFFKLAFPDQYNKVKKRVKFLGQAADNVLWLSSGQRAKLMYEILTWKYGLEEVSEQDSFDLIWFCKREEDNKTADDLLSRLHWRNGLAKLVTFGVGMKLDAAAQHTWCYSVDYQEDRAVFTGSSMTWERWQVKLIEVLDRCRACRCSYSKMWK